MTPERWQRIKTLFDDFRELPPARRMTLLADRCGEDHELRQELESLLAHHDSTSRAGAWASGDSDATRLGVCEKWSAIAPPAQIGRYRIIEPLGRGGMGIVYRAHQDHPQRDVALKIMQPTFVSESWVRRFEHEAEMLARLHHPGIAQIYELGRVDSAWGPLPFFAMELILGQPLTEFAHSAALDAAGRVQLMIRVCEAVEHAHQRGIIHRDLKPANILVEPSRQPKVLDFGVARLTDSDVQVRTLRTEVGELLGTLAYMSPEQVAGDPHDLDLRSDLYALGILLFEMLSGRPPYDLAHTPLPEALRRIREQEPPRLGALNRNFRGDLETIVAKSLEKDRGRRYGSAQELRSDLERFLQDRPITARPPTRLYQLRKFTRRNRALVGGMAAALAALLLGSGAATWQAIVAVRASGRAREAEGLATRRLAIVEEESRKSKKLYIFLADMLTSIKPEIAGAEDTVLLRQTLDRAAGSIEREFSGQPDLQAALHNLIGSTYRTIGAYAEAEQHLRQGLALREGLYGDRHLDVAGSLNDLGLLLGERGNLAEGRRLIEQALRIHQQLQPNDDAERAVFITNLGASWMKLGDFEKAEALLSEALDLWGRLGLPEDHPEILVCQDNMAELLMHKGDLEPSERLYRKVLELREARFGTPHPDVADSLNDLASVMSNRGNAADAEPLYRRAVEMLRETLNSDHPAIAIALNNLSTALRALGRFSEAEPYLRESIAIQRRHSGDHPELATTLSNLAVLLMERGGGDEALLLFEDALAIQRRRFPPRHPDLARTLNNLATVRLAAGDHAAAETLLRETLGIAREVLGEAHPNTAKVKANLGRSLQAQGKLDAADTMYRQAVDALRAANPRHADLGRALMRFTSLRLSQNQPVEAMVFVNEALLILRGGLPVDHPDIAEAEGVLGSVLSALGRDEEAELMMLQSYEKLLASRGPNDPRSLEALRRLIDYYERCGHAEQADALRARAEQPPEASLAASEAP